MNKLIRQTVTITISETWTIAWADGTAQTIVYRARQTCQLLPTNPNEPQGWTELEPIATHSSLCAAVVQIGLARDHG